MQQICNKANCPYFLVSGCAFVQQPNEQKQIQAEANKLKEAMLFSGCRKPEVVALASRAIILREGIDVE